MHPAIKHGLGTLCLVALAFGLYQVKYQVQGMREQVSEIEQQLVAKRKAVQVMSAEWAYLDRPERLAELQKKYLLSAPVMAQQITEVASLPQVDADTQLASTQPMGQPGLTTVSAVMVRAQGQ